MRLWRWICAPDQAVPLFNLVFGVKNLKKYVFSRIAKSQLHGKHPVKRLAVSADMHLRLGIRRGQGGL